METSLRIITTTIILLWSIQTYKCTEGFKPGERDDDDDAPPNSSREEISFTICFHFQRRGMKYNFFISKALSFACFPFIIQKVPRVFLPNEKLLLQQINRIVLDLSVEITLEKLETKVESFGTIEGKTLNCKLGLGVFHSRRLDFEIGD